MEQLRLQELKSIKPFQEIWFCHLAGGFIGKYNWYGQMPNGLLKHIKHLGIASIPTVHLCSGISKFGDVRVDIDPNSNATKIMDARETDLPDQYSNFTFLDPYYSEVDYAVKKQEPISVYDFIKEAVRVTKIGGYIGVLHTRQPRTPKKCRRVGFAIVHCGPDRLLRVFIVWQRIIR